MFIGPQPYSSWILNETTGIWESPVGPAPELTEVEIEAGSFYVWNEESQQWVLETFTVPKNSNF